MATCVYTLLFLCALAGAQTVESEIPMSDAARGVIPDRFGPTPADETRRMLPIPRAEEGGRTQLGAKPASGLVEDILADLPSHRDWRGLPILQRPSTTPFELITVRPPWQDAPGLVSAGVLRHKVPKDAKKAYERGLKALQKGDFPAAVEQLTRAIALDDEFAIAHANLGVAMVRQERLAEAAVELRRAIALDPHLPMTHSNLAWVLLQLGHTEEAQEWARRALELEPDNQPAKKLLERTAR